MKCESCNKKHDGSFGSGRFCNRNCAAKNANNKPEWKRKQSIAQKISQNRPDVRIKKSIAQRITSANPEVRSKRSVAQKNLWSENREKKIKDIQPWIQAGFRASPIHKSKVATKLLDWFEDFLEMKRGTIEREFAIVDGNTKKYYDGHYKNILIEVDGQLWHSSPDRIKNDRIKDSLAQKYNYKLHRIKI